MTPEQWQRIKEVLATALETEPDARDAFLAQSCAGDQTLRQEIDLLLRDEQQLGAEFLTRASLAVTAASVLPDDENPWIGRVVGSYRIVEQIGAGGMGEVYRAFRADDQYKKEVALKLVRSSQASGFVLARFKNERQILATLDHPNIARLLDGGTTEDGTPYFVMELVEGLPIGEYCDKHRLSIESRLELFCQVCSAVQYAHQHLIIHRDIKPSNVLVTGDGIPKLLDFGIAKILDFEAGSPDATLTAFRALTPRYASPEQIKGEPMTTASDVYSLGVVLYELLTGLGPYRLRSGSTQEIADAVCHRDPQKPSLALLTSPTSSNQERRVEADKLAGVRDTSAEKLRKRLSGDLDNVLLMALRKEPARRYTSVGYLQEDIRRHLENIPVSARNDTVWYRTSKFVTRNKVGVVASALVLLAVVSGVAITLQEARIARRRFNDVRSLANSLIFDVHDSIKDLPGSTPAKKIIVERALQYLNVLGQESTGDVGLQRELASAYERLGSVQGDYLENNLGDLQGTLASYKRALQFRQQIATSSRDWNDRLALATSYRLVAHQLEGIGDHREARDAIERAIAISEALNKEKANNPEVLYELSFDYDVSATIAQLSGEGKDKALQDYRRALAINEIAVRLNPEDIRYLYSYSADLTNIGIILEESDAREALKYYEKSLQIDLKIAQLSRTPHYQRSVAVDYGTIASVYDDIGDYPRAVENNMKDLEIYQNLVSKDPKNFLLRRGLAIASVNTAASCVRAGQIDLAMAYSNRGLEIMRELVASAPDKSYQQRKLAQMLLIRGIVLTAANQPEAAIAEIEQARSIYEERYKKGNAGDQVSIGAADVKLGEAAAKAGHDQAATDHFQEALNRVGSLITKEPADLDALYCAADAYSGLAEIHLRAAQQRGEPAGKRKADLTEAQAWFSQSLHTWQRIPHPYHTAPTSFQVGDPALVAKRLKIAEAAMAATH